MALKRAALLGGAGVALLLASLAAAFLAPHAKAWPTALAAAALVALVVAAVIGRNEIAVALRRRQARRGGLVAAHAAFVLAVAATLAFLAARHSVRGDLTFDRRHSLGREARRVLDALPEHGGTLEIYAIDTLLGGATSTAGGQALGPILETFHDAAPDVQTRFVVAEQEPALVRELGLTRPPAIVVRYRPPEGEPRVRTCEVLTEDAVAAAIEQAMLGALPRALVVTGHGEMGLADHGPLGFLVAAQDMESDNFRVEPLTLAEGGVPDDAALVIVPGPQVDLLPSERDALHAYRERGGRLLVLLGPNETDDALDGWRTWLREDWGVDARQDVVADLDGLAAGGDVLTLVVQPDASLTHPIVAERRQMVVLPVTRTVRKASFVPDWTEVTVLLRSGPHSWSETDPRSSAHYDEGVDEKGPLPLAVAARTTRPGAGGEARLVVFGSSRFAANHAYFQQGNPQLLLDAVAWLASREDVLAARRGSHRDGTVVVADSQFRLVSLAVLLVPVAFLLGGAAQWAHRRRL